MPQHDLQQQFAAIVQSVVNAKQTAWPNRGEAQVLLNYDHLARGEERGRFQQDVLLIMRTVWTSRLGPHLRRVHISMERALPDNPTGSGPQYTHIVGYCAMNREKVRRTRWEETTAERLWERLPTRWVASYL